MGKEVAPEIESDRNNTSWMKDYSKQSKVEQNSKKPNTSQYRNEDFQSRTNNYSAITHRLKLETNNIYKGMPYDEWTKIYEEFVKKKLDA